MIQMIEAEESDYLYTDVSQIANAGLGLYTAIKIFKDEQIAIFEGELLTRQEAEKRAKQNEDQYFISLLNGKTLDSKHITCFAKFANDAKGSETAFKNNCKITLNELDQVCLVANKTIKAGEEIFTGYGKVYWKKHG
ncbi:MAG: SET domain-containing protein [Bacteroidota bacterium]|nr:SET domain-containing protein [Bacteroidota bacterium]